MTSCIGVALHRRQIFLGHDRPRHRPRRVDDDIFHHVREFRCQTVRLVRPHDRACLEGDLPVVDNGRGEGGDIDQHVTCAAFLVQPAFTLHRDDDGLQPRLDALVDLGHGAGAGNAVLIQPVIFLKAAHRLLQSGVIGHHVGPFQIPHRHQPVAQRDHLRALRPGLERGCRHRGAPTALGQQMLHPQLFTHQGVILHRPRAQIA